LLDSGKPYTIDRIVRIGIGIAVIWGIVWLLGYLSDVLIPFAVALLMAYLINPLVELIQRKIRHRALAVFISLFTVFVGLCLVIGLLVPLIINEVTHMGALIGDLVNNSDLAHRAREQLPPDLWQAVKQYAARPEVQEFFTAENFWALVEGLAYKILPGAWGLITGTVSFLIGLVGLFTIVLYLVFLLLDYQKVRKRWSEIIPPKYREVITTFIHEVDEGMNRYFRAQALVASIVGVLFATGFWIIGLPLGILFGLFVGLLNMVPYLQLVALIPAFFLSVIYALDTGTSIWISLLLTALVFAIVQLIQDTILVPRIMGKVTGLSPAMILLSLSIWGKLLGIFGLIIALPMTVLLWAYYQRLLATGNLLKREETGA